VVGNLRYDRLGDKLEVKTEEEADGIIEGGAAFLGKSDFDSCGFTQDELRKHATPGTRVNAPPEFIAKYQRAQEIFQARCAQLRQATADRHAALAVEAAAAPDAPAEQPVALIAPPESPTPAAPATHAEEEL